MIPDTVTAISYHAFSGCENLKEVTLPSGLKEIGSSAFLRCSSMSSILVPKTVEEIGANALGYLNIESIWNEEDDTWTYEGEKMPDFTILGYEGSAAQAYAKENDIAFAALAEYNDVNQGDWYYRYVNWAYANGLMKGYENGDFGPADNLTRGSSQLSCIATKVLLTLRRNPRSRMWRMDSTILTQLYGQREQASLADMRMAISDRTII